MRFKSILFLLFLTGALYGQNCEIFDLQADIISTSPVTNCTYFVKLDFKHSGGTNQFTVTGNGINYGTFPYSQNPVTLGPFNSPVTTTNLEFIVTDAVFTNCSDQTIVTVTSCITSPCEIKDLMVLADSCSTDSTYFATIDFDVITSPASTDSFVVYINSTQFGAYKLSELPLEIPEFPWGGGSVDTVRICLLTPPSIVPCCVDSKVNVPDCLNPCLLKDLSVVADSCNSDSTFRLTINLLLTDSTASDSIDLYVDGDLFGKYAANAWPLTIDSFLWNGLIYANVKVCAGDSLFSCCKEVNFLAPDCLPFAPCEVTTISLEAGSCSGDSTYSAKVFFNATNPGNGTYTASVNGVLIDTFPLTNLPLELDSLTWNGDSTLLIQICIGADTLTPGTVACCFQDTFPVPACLTDKPCSLYNLVVDPGACGPNSDSTYSLVLNFLVKNPGDSTFVVFNTFGDVIDTFALSQLPLTIPDFKWGGGQKDELRVCITDSLSCCQTVEFDAPDCLPFPCEITALKVEGDSCTSDSTFRVVINFEVNNQPDSTFVVSVGNSTFGPYNISQLPLTINNFPSGNDTFVDVTVCIANADSTASDCCKTKEVKLPDCSPNNDCDIIGLAIETGDCASDSTYTLFFNFQSVNAPSDSVLVSANGTALGTYPATAFPVKVLNFPWGGGDKDKVTVCYIDSTGAATSCCASKEFFPPDCITNNGPCEIYDLAVETDSCTSDSTYIIVVNFQVNNAPGNEFSLYANGAFFGSYNLNQLPLTITNFPYNGGQNDVVKVCFDNSNCCATKEFPVPNCLFNDPCSIDDLTVITGDCTGDSTYVVKVNFQVANPPGNVFTLFANGVLFGTYELNQLPLTIQNFPWNGGPNDVIKVCFDNATTCCETKEFAVPDCLNNNNNCEISNFEVFTFDCTGDSTYVVKINFQAQNPPSDSFQVYANGQPLGFYTLAQLPLIINNFPWNGGPNDVIKVCFDNATTCCETKEFAVPDCLTNNNPCEISNLQVLTGDCTGDSTYVVKISFQAQNPPSDSFQVYANGQPLGFYTLAQLTLTIQNFPWNGGPNDVVKVCFDNALSCCATKEFAVPACLDPGAPCSVSNLAVEIGDCTSDSTYKVVLNFTVNNPPSNEFGVWANNTFLGTFNVSQLPLTINNFPWDGGLNDFVKVCFGNGGVATCCGIKEFAVPSCLNPSGPCVITNLNIEVGDCTGNDTYKVVVNFQVSNAISNTFELFANGTLFGTYNLNQLPLTINNFPWDGGPNDFIKVCLVPNAPNQPGCCAVKEFAVPGCLSDNCKIYDLVVIKSPCLCGQFFALLQFKFTNPGAAGFEVVLNGNVEATYPYNFPQPIIIGPLAGDNITEYKFVIKDKEDPTCAEDFNLGKVDCPQTPTFSPTDGGNLIMSPNPTTDWLNVGVQLRGAGKPGQSAVDVYHADGRLVLSRIIADGTNFQLDVSGLPAGIYRMVMQTELGRLEGTLAKQ